MNPATRLTLARYKRERLVQQFRRVTAYKPHRHEKAISRWCDHRTVWGGDTEAPWPWLSIASALQHNDETRQAIQSGTLPARPAPQVSLRRRMGRRRRA